MSNAASEIPAGSASGFTRYFRDDFRSGFFVFLIALPLCLGISIASGFPPLAGVFTAIIGGIVCTFISNSELTIKGPAAGLIVIVLGCVAEFGGDGAVGGFGPEDFAAYRAALAVGVVAAGLQVAFGLFRGGVLAEFFPKSVVHGMLAAIGIIIMLKQIPVALGAPATGEPLEIIREMPEIVAHANPAIAMVGVVCIALMFAWPLVTGRLRFLKPIPAPIAVLAVAVPMSLLMDLAHPHEYELAQHIHDLGPQHLVAMPDRVFGMFDAVTLPDFSALAQPAAWKWVLMFFLIGSTESLLSAKAVDLLDPHKRRTNLNRDMIAVGVGNTAAAFVGGLPMISEIVRSRANIDNGAKTRFADFWHAVMLLVCVATIPMALHMIPLAALAAMLVYTGFRLAHPNEFRHALHIGVEQLVVFVATVVGVLATDLLVGVGIGIAVKVLFHIANGVPPSSMFKPFLDIEMIGENACVVRARKSAVFSNWIPFRKQLVDLAGVHALDVTLDLSGTRFIDHSTMEKLHELEAEIHADGGVLRVVGLDTHTPLSAHELAARKASRVPFARIEVVAPGLVARELGASLADRPVVGLHLAEAELAGSPDGGAAPFAVLRFVCPRPLCAELEERVSTRIAGIPGACVAVSDVRSAVGLGVTGAGLPSSVAS